MELLHVYPAIAVIANTPRTKAEQVTICGIELHVYRNTNVYLDTNTLVTRTSGDPTRHTYCLEIRAGLLTVLTTASTDEALESRMTTIAEWGDRAGKRPIDGIAEWTANALAVANDTEGYTAKARTKLAEQRAAREAEDIQRKAEREERESLATIARIQKNAKAFTDGEYLDFAGFEELCNLAGIVMPIRTIGACRKNVSAVSRTSITVRGGSKPMAIWTAVRALEAAYAKSVNEAA